MNRIKELPKSSAHLLSSTVVIASIHSVVKELIENSLDSDATNVELKLEDYGLEKIEVKDNGRGIHKDDMQYVAKPHCTSKITCHLDLSQLNTYGFRGEALAALCAVSDLMIVTKTEEDEYGYSYTFNHNGDVLTSKPCHSNQGTTLIASNLFKNFPVRKQYYRTEKNKKDELKKIEDILTSFGCIHTVVRFTLSHNRNLVWQKSSVDNVREGLVLVFGHSVVDNLENCEYDADESKFHIEVFLPKREAPLHCSHSSPSKSIVSINKRPVRLKIIDKLLKDYYCRGLSTNGKARYPICFISMTVPPADIDVNMDPNKTLVALTNVDCITEQLSAILKAFYDCDTQVTTSSTFKVTDTDASCHNVVTKRNELCKMQKEAPDMPMKATDVTVISKLPDSTNRMLGLKPCTSKKLSRKENHEIPSSKRVRTSSSFVSPPNDIYRHMKTLDAFLNNAEKTKETESGSKKFVGSTETPDAVAFRENFQPNSTNTINSSSVNQPTSEIDSPVKRRMSEPNLQISNLDPPKKMVKSPEIIPMPGTEWSRGNHPVEKFVQPVTVLAPKYTEQINCSENEQMSKVKDVSHSTISPNCRKMTAFDFFCRKQRLEVASMNPDFSNQQIAQLLTEKWSKMPPEEKIIFKNMINKDYPKHVINKEKLGDSITKNFCGKENHPAQIKNSFKKKTKIRERKIKFEMLSLKNQNLRKYSCQSSGTEWNIVSCIMPGVWICTKEKKISLLNISRLHETIIYYRLLETFQFNCYPLLIPLQITESFLGRNIVNMLDTLKERYHSEIDDLILDKRLLFNGFKVKFIKGAAGTSVEIVGKTDVIDNYGERDFIEILQHLENNIESKLSECRPESIVTYLKQEATRIVKQSPVLRNKEDVCDILENRKNIPSSCERCIHSKPFFYKLYEIATE